MAGYYPALAQKLNISGRVSIQCIVDAVGTLNTCTVVSEDPPGYGFGEATLKLTRLFRVRPMTIDGIPTAGGIFKKTVVWQLGK